MEKNNNSFVKKFISIFFNKQFILFAVIGLVNTINTTLFSTLYSKILPNIEVIPDANLAFMLGYITSLAIAYPLNSFFTFKEKLSLKKFRRFIISYIPNFLIQNVVFVMIYRFIDIPENLSFFVAAIIGVPVTFLILKFFAFKNKKS